LASWSYIVRDSQSRERDSRKIIALDSSNLSNMTAARQTHLLF